MKEKTDIFLFEQTERDFTHNGIGVLEDFMEEPEINRIINGRYAMIGVYDLFGQLADRIKKGMIIKAMCPNGTYQPFRIDTLTKTSDSIEFQAKHYCYDANRNFVESLFVPNGNGQTIMRELQSNLTFKQEFVYRSDVETTHQFTAKEGHPIDILIGSNNGNQNLTGVVSGELDMYDTTIYLRDRLGSDNGFRVDYGINLEAIEETIEEQELPNSLYLIGAVPEGDYDEEREPIVLKYLEAPGIVVTDENRVIRKYKNEDCETKEQLRQWADNVLFAKQKIHLPKVIHKISMVDLAGTIEYAEYESFVTLDIGDTVHGIMQSNGEAIEERMIEYSWYPRLAEYKSLTLGNDYEFYTQSTQDSINSTLNEMIKTKQELSESLVNATELINGVDGGSVYQYPKNRPYATYYLDSDSIESAKEVMVLNNKGIGFSKKGWQGPFSQAWTIDGVLNADFIKAGTLEGVTVKTTNNGAGQVVLSGGEIKIHTFSWANYQKVGAIGPASGNGEGFVISPEKGCFFLLTNGEGYPILKIPTTSNQANPEWETKGKHTHNGEFHIRGKLIVNGKEITGSTGSGNGTPPILTTEQEKNAWFIWQYFKNNGWTEQSIAGMLGNMQSESGIIPDIDEHGGGGGYGLVQWTPKSKLVDWCNERGVDYRTLDSQCQRIQWEMKNEVQWLSTNNYPYTFRTYTQKTNISECAWAFLVNYERPANANQPIRAIQAQYWYDKFTSIGNYDWKNPVRSQYIVTQEWDDNDYWSGGVSGNHGGIDLASVPAGSKSPIYSAKSGTVMTRATGTVEGNYLMIDHGNSYYTYYGHLDSFSVAQGQTVTTDTIIGVMGTTGGSTGVHLHFEVRKGGSSSNYRINPRDVINF